MAYNHQHLVILGAKGNRQSGRFEARLAAKHLALPSFFLFSFSLPRCATTLAAVERKTRIRQKGSGTFFHVSNTSQPEHSFTQPPDKKAEKDGASL
jgi:hypothetical protein